MLQIYQKIIVTGTIIIRLASLYPVLMKKVSPKFQLEWT